MSRFSLKFVIAAALVFTGGSCFAKEHTSRIDDDPSHESNWMMNLEQHKILDRETYRSNLQKMRLRLEADLARNPEPDANSYSGRRFQLLQVYYALGLTAEADALVKPTDVSGIDQSSFILQNLHQRRNRVKLVGIYKRYYEEHKDKIDPSLQCAELVQIADINYKLGQMDEAEKLYKEAYQIALKTATPPGKTREAPGSITISPFNSYACFLADKGRIDESRVPIEQAFKYWEAGDLYSVSSGYGGFDDFGAYLTIVKKKSPALYDKLSKLWQKQMAKESAVGLIAKDGHEITGPRFFTIGSFSNNLAVAQDRLTRRFGYIDKTGVWKLQPTFVEANPFSRGIATAKLADGLLPIDISGTLRSFSLIDGKGRELKNLNATYATAFVGDLCVTSRTVHGHSENTVFNLVDRSGEVLYSGKFLLLKNEKDQLYSIFIPTYWISGGCVVSCGGYKITFSVEPDPLRKGHLKLVQQTNDLSGSKLSQEQPFYVLEQKNKTLQINNDTCTIGYDNSVAYLLNHAGKKISKNYANLERLNANCFRVCNGPHGWGLLDATGAEIVPPKYDEVRAMSDGMAAVRKNDKWGFVNDKAREVVAAKYDEVGNFLDGLSFYRRKQNY